MIDNLTTNMRAVSLRDPAIDLEQTDIEKYSKTRDYGLLAFKPGALPVTPILRPLTYAVAQTIRGFNDMRVQTGQAFRLSVLCIENFAGRDTAFEPTDTVTIAGDTLSTWKDQELNAVFQMYGSLFVEEMGMLVLQRAEGGKAWGGAERYTPPPFLAAELDQMKRQRAELLRLRDERRSSGQSASG